MFEYQHLSQWPTLATSAVGKMHTRCELSYNKGCIYCSRNTCRAVAAATAMAVPLLRSYGPRETSKKAIQISLIYVHVHDFSGRVLRAQICMDIIPGSMRFAPCMQASVVLQHAPAGRGQKYTKVIIVDLRVRVAL